MPTKTKRLPARPSVDELAEFFGRNRKVVYRELEAGNIPGARRIGHRWCIDGPTVERWLRGEQHQAAG